MSPSNIDSEYFSKLDNEKLLEIFSSPKNYSPDAVERAREILSLRGYAQEKLDEIKEKSERLGKRIFDTDLLGKIKENAAIVIALDYGLGYLGWSIYAANQSLGTVAAFDLQYILAGVIPTIAVMLLYIFIRKKKALMGKWDSLLKKRKILKISLLLFTTAALFLSVLFVLDMIAFAIVQVLNYFSILAVPVFNKTYHHQLSLNFILTSSAFLFVSLAIHPIDFNLVTEWRKIKNHFGSVKRQNKEKEYRYEKIVYVTRKYCQYLLGGMLIILALVFFNIKLLPRIPQEIGGAKSKAAVIVSEKSIFNSKSICPDNQSKIFQDTVLVFYESSSLIIYGDPKDKNSLKSEVNRSVILNLKWLPEKR